ncbi:TonB-dependent receptor domain-containing protein [Vibrio sinaloensis]|uniref:TonB-dependent receptor domain-containing protein n=1 Tax=Photobacterium sp. (strain ATCC 43367) TaxID=379097 RepID=UPI00057E907C|nr:TonB-dependent receptor [Vibrio sinaloensis]KHT51252.1 ligand-gated channel protein [Vibrio sinaloensis]
MNRSILAMAMASLLPSTYSIAQDVSVDETMVITANRFEQPLNEVITSTTIVSKQEIEAIQAKSLVDVLKRVPGVEVSQSGGRGHSASVFVRGFNSNQVLFLVDGVRINSAAGGISFNHIPVGIIERVEVIKGPGGALYGSDAIAGVINVITSSSESNEGTVVSLGAGSDAQKEANFSTTRAFANGGILKLAGGFEETDGFDIKDPATGLDYGYESQNLFASYSQAFNEQFSGSASVRWYDSLTEYDSGGKNYGYSENLSITADVQYHGDKLSSTFRANQQAIENLNYSQAQGKDNAGTEKKISLTNLQFLNQYSVSENFTVGAGADWRREKLDDDALSYGNPDKLAGESRNTTGVYLSTDVQFGDLQLTGSVRNDKHDTYDNHVTWSLGTRYHLTQAHSLRAALGTSFKAPSYSDLTNNSDLKPEEAISREIGYTGEFELFTLDVTAYDNDVDNLIIWYEGSPWWYPENVDAELRGLEISGTFNTGFIHHTLIAEFKDHQDSGGNKLAKRADENYKWLLDASYEDFDFNLTYTYTGERLGNPKEVSDPKNELPSVSLWDASVGYWVSQDLVVRARVDNLTNEKYQTTLSYNAPERRYFANLTYQF